MLNTELDGNLNLSSSTSGEVFKGSSAKANVLGYSGTVYGTNADGRLSCWKYWTDIYYPNVIYQSYPVYIRERAMDKGKQAFEIIKMLKDKKIIKLEKVGDFIDVMDELIKIL